MDKDAVKQAQQRLARARTAVVRLEEHLCFDDICDAWGQFLLASSGIYSKLETGSKNTRSNGWFGAKKAERKNDELLSYLHHARNVDEHGIAPLTKFDGFRIHFRDAANAFVRVPLEPFEPGRQTIEATRADGTPGAVDVQDLVQLMPVTDRGVTYTPPTTHLGLQIQPQDILAIARAGLAYLEGLVREAKLRS